MCLAVPHTIIETDGETSALARAGNVEVSIRTDLLEGVVPGDKVLVHAGFAIEKLSQEDGEERERLWEELAAFAEGEPPVAHQ
ncbi:MAG: HypC/HybG/HupF family hydrogenase formation chaperone [Synergistales bacterium]|nr:HypC/HybG/HupF family hydrogenase formation chaperone [Synergistales bacterium]